jgi:ankyrin repeat protein
MRYDNNICPINANRDTPLHVALRHGHEQFCFELVSRFERNRIGINRIDIENVREKMTPYFIAVL